MDGYIFIFYFLIRTISEPFVQPKSEFSSSSYKRENLVTLSILVLSFYLAGIYIAFALFYTPVKDKHIFLIALILASVSYIMRVATMHYLSAAYSRNISCTKAGILVTSGIYKKIRHPLYAFYLLEMF